MKRHQAYSRDLSEADRAILFIHGIVGSPDHFRDFYERVPLDWSIRSLLIEGHGGTVRQFSRSSMASWQEQVSKVVDELAGSHSSILITGHSMGTLLAIEQALRRPEQVAGLFLLAVPLYARPSLAAMSQSIRTALGLDPGGDPRLEAAHMLYSIDPDKRVWRYLGYLPRYYELLQVMRETRGKIPRLAIPCRVLMSRHDEIVSPRSADDLHLNPLVSLDWLEQSDHKYYPAEDKAFLLDEFAGFCRNRE